MIIFYNQFSKNDRDFVAAYGEGETLVDYYSFSEDVSRMVGQWGKPRQFPTLIDEATGVIVSGASSPVDLQEAVIDYTIEKVQTYLRKECELALVSGFQHDALGVIHLYPTTPNDQMNLSISANTAEAYGDSTGPYKFWCADENGVWARRPHTAAQIIAVGLALLANGRTLQDHYESKLIELSQATTLEEMEAIQW